MLRGPMTYRVKNCGCWEMHGPKNMKAFFSHHCDKHDPVIVEGPPEEKDEVAEVVEALNELVSPNEGELLEDVAKMGVIEDVVDGKTGAVIEGDEAEEIVTEPDVEPGDFKFE